MGESIITRKGGGEDLPQTELPIINFISKTDNSLTFTIENTDEEKAIVYYELDDETPDANSVNLNGNSTTSNLIFTGLTPNTSYTLHVWATAFGKKVSQVVDSIQITTITTPDPTLTYVSKTWDTITFTVKNNDNVESTIYYQNNVTPPLSNSVTLAAGITSSNLTISGLTKTTSYTIYAQGETFGKLKSNILSFTQTTLDWETLTNPTITFVSATTSSITFTVRNNSSTQVDVYYGTSSNPSSTFVSLNANTTSSNLTIGGLNAGSQYTVYAISKKTNYYNSSQVSLNMSTLVPTGETSYRSSGTYSWTCPTGVTSVSVVAIGGGGGGSWYYANQGYGNQGGGAGALAWRNDISVTPGQTYTVVVGVGGSRDTLSWYSTGSDNSQPGGTSSFINTSTLAANGGHAGVSGTGSAASFTAPGGGGGVGGRVSNYLSNSRNTGGGGAGGYSGKGGDAGYDNNTNYAQDGVGGGSGGGAAQFSTSSKSSTMTIESGVDGNLYYEYRARIWRIMGSNGGGTGIYGQGSNGLKGAKRTSADWQGPLPGGNGSQFSGSGAYGRGGGGSTSTFADIDLYTYNYDTGEEQLQTNWVTNNNRSDNLSDSGVNGAVRIIWGPNRLFPSTNTLPM
jgi:hypothetical protein